MVQLHCLLRTVTLGSNPTVTVANNPTVTIGSSSITQPVSGTVTLSSQTVTLGSNPTVTVANNPTVTIGATSVTQPVSGTVTLSSQTVTLAASTVTVASGTIATDLDATGVVPNGTNGVGTAATIANAATGTISYTVTTGKTLYLKGFSAASSGGPCKVICDYGAGPTVICVGFYSAAGPGIVNTFPEAIPIAASTVVNLKIQNNAGAAQDLYGTLFGVEK